MPLIPFPNVPNFPGVPSLPRSAQAQNAFLIAGVGILQDALFRAFQTRNQWGIFDADGNALGDPNNFADLTALGIGATLSTNALDYSKEMRISDFPLERGSFAAYNKVETPANPLVTLCFTGSEDERSAFLTAVDDATKSTDLYSVVTPEKTYVDYSLERYNYQRRSYKGATLLYVEISLKEIRQVSSAYSQSSSGQISNPQDYSAAITSDGGKVQAAAPDVSTLKAIGNKFPALLNSVNSLLGF